MARWKFRKPKFRRPSWKFRKPSAGYLAPLKRYAKPIAFGLFGAFAYKYTPKIIDNKWVQYGTYGLLMTLGIYTPAALAVFDAIQPSED